MQQSQQILQNLRGMEEHDLKTFLKVKKVKFFFKKYMYFYTVYTEPE